MSKTSRKNRIHQKKIQNQKQKTQSQTQITKIHFKTGIHRDKTGRIRKKYPPQQTVIEQRMRFYNLDKHTAKTQKAGSIIGRMALKGILSDEEYQAGLFWLTLSKRHQIACQTPRLKQSSAFNPIQEKNSTSSQPQKQEEEKMHQIWVKQYDQARNLILKIHPLAHIILQSIVEEEIYLKEIEQINILKQALTALHTRGRRAGFI